MTVYIAMKQMGETPIPVSVAKGGTLAVWVPSEQLACHWVDVPPVSAKKWQAMIPWLVEDKLLAKPEDSHFVWAKKQHNRVPVLVVAKEQLQQWQQQLDSNLGLDRNPNLDKNLDKSLNKNKTPLGNTQLDNKGYEISALIPDFFALPWQEGQIALTVVEDRCIIRFDEWQGAAAPIALMADLLTGLFEGKALVDEKVLVEGEVLVDGDVLGDEIAQEVATHAKHLVVCGQQAMDALSQQQCLSQGLLESLLDQAQLKPDVDFLKAPPQAWLSVSPSQQTSSLKALSLKAGSLKAGSLSALSFKALTGAGSGPLPVKIAAVLTVLALGLQALTYWQESQHIQAQANYFEEQLLQGYRQYFNESYDFELSQFKRVVTAKMAATANSDGSQVLLQQMDIVLKQCKHCRLQTLNFVNNGSDGAQLDGYIKTDSAEKPNFAALQTNSALTIKVDAVEDLWRLSLNAGQH